MVDNHCNEHLLEDHGVHVSKVHETWLAARADPNNKNLSATELFKKYRKHLVAAAEATRPQR